MQLSDQEKNTCLARFFAIVRCCDLLRHVMIANASIRDRLTPEIVATCLRQHSQEGAEDVNAEMLKERLRRRSHRE